MTRRQPENDGAAAGHTAEVIHDSAASNRTVREAAEAQSPATLSGPNSGPATTPVPVPPVSDRRIQPSRSPQDSALGDSAVIQDSASADDAVTSRENAVVQETPAPEETGGETLAKAAPEHYGASAKRKPRGRWWRGFTGSVAAGMAVLAVGVLVVGVLCLVNGAPGPGVLKLVGHPVAALIMFALQRVADRRVGKVAVAAGVGVLVVAGVAFSVLWWF
ncbi:hypothetical protein [Amycolatopsis orientalis]|uniref:hypothetical protein n=1 Tax=Amycolatopsis orientalis TaxID=31958 RepID=UPI0003A4EF52|nr:hypothetical protein [Amycolatopsis orientalis]